MTNIEEQFQEYGINYNQYIMLREFQYDSRPYDSAVINVYRLTRTVNLALPHCEDYLDIIEQCFKNKWLHYVTADEERLQKRRKLREKIPQCDTGISRRGDVDLTLLGYTLCSHAYRGIFDLPLAGQRLLNEKGSLYDLYALTEADCLKYIEKQREMFQYDPVMVKNTAPKACGPWRLSRFEKFDKGFVCRVRRLNRKKK